MFYTISGITHIGEIRSVNQDNYYINKRYRKLEQNIESFSEYFESNNPWIMAVFDGMGGENYGEIASLIGSLTTDEFCSETENQYDVERLIQQINSRICKEIEEKKSRMGSTCVFAEFESNSFRSWNIGDSRAYFFHDGLLTQVSVDHTEAASYSSFFNSAKSRSENRLTQNLGIPEDDYIIEPSVSEWFRIQKGDFVLLCSDGLTHLVSDESIADVLKKELSGENKCRELMQLALDKGGLDNITILLAEAI